MVSGRYQPVRDRRRAAEEWKEDGLQWDVEAALKNMPSPRRKFHSLSLAGSALYMFGGETKGGKSCELYLFNMAEEAWILVQPSGPSPPPLSHHASAVVHNMLYIVGGVTESGALNDSLFRLDIGE